MAHILVADDALIQRISISKLLKEEGHETTAVADGAKALEILSTQQIDCIVTDLIMPEMTGFELLDALAEKNSKVPVIVVTADIQESTKSLCQEKGVVALLNKPVKAVQLRGALKMILDCKHGAS